MRHLLDVLAHRLDEVATHDLISTAKLLGAVPADDNDEVMLITDGGTLVRTPVKDVSVLSRDTQGVKMINVAGGPDRAGTCTLIFPLALPSWLSSSAFRA